MLLSNPVQITPRLLPGVRVGGAWLSIEYAHTEGHRQHYRYYIDLPNRFEYSADDLSSGCRHSLQHGLQDLCMFLSALGDGSCESDGWPREVKQWAIGCADDLSLMAMDLEETEGLIQE